MTKRIVVKIGTNTLSKNGNIDIEYILSISKEIASLIKQGCEIVLVSSGAIGFGSLELKKPRSREIKLNQALAAVGQPIQISEYAKAFSTEGIKVAQLLLTNDVFSNRKTYLNLRNCIENLLAWGVIPILNENDVISIDEIGTAFGDNDYLSALVASKLNADILIILTDIDGLYTDNPKKNPNAKKIDAVEKITPEIERYAGKAGSALSSGGMKSKVRAAKVATNAGCSVVIAHGRMENVLSRILGNEKVGTFFAAKGKISARQRWILSSKPKGRIVINECAVPILKEGKSSLLPVGIEKVEGSFKAGEIVEINDFARGITHYSSRELNKIKRMKSQDASKVLKKKVKEVISKENIVIS